VINFGLTSSHASANPKTAFSIFTDFKNSVMDWKLMQLART
jgi:hypothetical protein